MRAVEDAPDELTERGRVLGAALHAIRCANPKSFYATMLSLEVLRAARSFCEVVEQVVAALLVRRGKARASSGMRTMFLRSPWSAIQPGRQ